MSPGETTDNSLRPMLCELNILTRSDGSAMLTQGETAVVAAVNGPMEVRMQHMNVEKAHIEIHFKPRFGLGGVNDRLLEDLIKRTYESVILTSLHPRTAISIQIQEMQDRGGLVACTINAVCLALMNSGIEMKHLVAAVHCVIDEKGHITLDPDELQSKHPRAKFTFVFENVSKNTVSIYTHGKFTLAEYHEVLRMATGAVEKVFNFYGEIIAKQSEGL
ncbi:exosome complex component RRP46 [Toxorhynchites rutilus septentrionalis]|uniref:exosome complex component RRP46 n=1 Tax=Toxorhynchites rutilus septentrionalis TaxID=329112 RepID=UPI002478CBBA|nr:exosome complex component RRP46 [Toxorhynchites rutilus septentrionalis]